MVVLVMIRHKIIQAHFILLNLHRLSPTAWWVPCHKNKNNMPYKATVRVHAEVVSYKQKHYYQADLPELFKRIANDIKGTIP